MPIIVISSQLDKNILTSVLKSSCNLKNSMNNFTINISKVQVWSLVAHFIFKSSSDVGPIGKYFKNYSSIRKAATP